MCASRLGVHNLHVVVHVKCTHRANDISSCLNPVNGNNTFFVGFFFFL